MKKQRKKRTAAIAVSLYLLGTFLIVGMLRVYRITHDTIHHEPLPATAVTQTEDEDEITLVLSVAEDDTGMVIGRHGKIAKAIRSVMKAAATNIGKRVNVEIQ